MTVKQVKGLEFDTAFVFDEGMDKNEKYIAYTRALSELYVFSKVPGKGKKALDIKDEPVPKGGKKKETKKLVPEFPEIYCDEEPAFYDHTVVYQDDDIYITMIYPEVIDACFVMKMALRMDPEEIVRLDITAMDISFNGGDIQIGQIPVFVPSDELDEQVITFAIPLSKFSKDFVEELEKESDDVFYEFYLNVQYLTENDDEYDEDGELISADLHGEYFEDEDEDEDDEDGEKYDYDDEPTSINELGSRNKNKLLIVVRESWSNDFCFVVEKFDGQMARGRQYLNGNFHRSTGFNKNHKEFTMYKGPSRKKIEDQYE